MSQLKTTDKAIEKSTTRDKILKYEKLLSEQENAFFGDSINCPLKHHFTDGIYTREIFIPAGMHIVGKIHKHEHPNFLVSGTVEVITENNGIERLTGPLFMISPPGTKRALRAITDLVWITVHYNPTNTQDLNKIEKYVIAEDYASYESFRKISDNKIVKFITKLKRLCLG